MVIAADNDKALEGQEIGRNPGLIKGQQAASANGAVLMAPAVSEEEIAAGFTDWNDLASSDPVRAASVAKELGQALQKAFALQDVLARHLATGQQSSVPSTEQEEHNDPFDGENEAPGNDQNISSGVDSGGNVDQADEEPVWELSSGELQNKQIPPAPLERNPQLEWDFRIGRNGSIEHFRTGDGLVAVRESADKIHILAKDHDAMALALERALERFGAHLHFDGNQAGARTLVDIVVTHDLQVTFTDDRLNAQIELRRVHNDLDRGRLISTSEREQTPAQKRGAGVASVSTPEKNIAGNMATLENSNVAKASAEVLIEHGEAPFDFDKENKVSYFVRTVDDVGEERLYWGKDLPRALEEAGARIGDVITATRMGSKHVTVKELQEQPDGSKQEVVIDARRNTWEIAKHGHNAAVVIKEYDRLVKSPESRRELEKQNPGLVAARDSAVVQQKRERLQQELTARSARQGNSLRI